MRAKILEFIIFFCVLSILVLIFNFCQKSSKICSLGYTGESCQTQVTPSKIKIDYIKIDSFPTFINGHTWDVSDGPDLFISIYKDSLLIYQSLVNNNATNTRDYYFYPNPVIEIKDMSANYTVKLFDDDIDFDHDLMGDLSHKYSSTGGFPTSISSTKNGVKIVMNFTYSW
ncbi:MAG: hypothetical protein A2275_10445 [Bacteroidetes bacterium RIFOXYA12_FULL_35_11]|nr:MAG: hypothetical protein A2X01_12855 [Bacteroidetes bacterium GWF2_35_48]OFY74487.1 MAG: hypothetical protein A2275_10445 [Bacteroidetes bacterium RIFOXYA12_FULL_35_11]OFY99827.1 MAG: hypothetical protein A2491_12265 [Bacteroidetes bacterium RIFOXYC12_FULL_35_7]HBX50298.1 hypothetical protein [Bacteroidales bacterium]